MAHKKLEIKHELRDPLVQGKVLELARILTQPRGNVEEALRKYDELVANFNQMEEVWNSYNISKEELMKTIEGYRTLCSSTEDLC